MTNFNHERLVITAQGNRMARICIEEAINYARARKTFGKRLIDHQVISHKIAEMVRHVENNHAMIEHLVNQMQSGAALHLIHKMLDHCMIILHMSHHFCNLVTDNLMINKSLAKCLSRPCIANCKGEKDIWQATY